MTNPDFEQFAQGASVMSDEDKRALRDMLDEQLSGHKNGSAGKSVNTFGWAKGRITIAENFDAPLDDFKDYEK